MLDAQPEPSDNGASVVFVPTATGEAVVKQGRGLAERLTSHLEDSLGPCLGYSGDAPATLQGHMIGA
jgi:hypothetical protein